MQTEKFMVEIIYPDKQPFIDSVSDLVKSEAERLEVEEMVNWIMEEGKNF